MILSITVIRRIRLISTIRPIRSLAEFPGMPGNRCIPRTARRPECLCARFEGPLAFRPHGLRLWIILAPLPQVPLGRSRRRSWR